MCLYDDQPHACITASLDVMLLATECNMLLGIVHISFLVPYPIDVTWDLSIVQQYRIGCDCQCFYLQELLLPLLFLPLYFL